MAVKFELRPAVVKQRHRCYSSQEAKMVFAKSLC